MVDSARVRISRVKPKVGGAVIEMLPVREPPDDTNFVPTLVWVLDQARRGKLIGYAMVFTVETDEGKWRSMEAARGCDDDDKHHVLGLIRRMEANYMARTWPEDEL